MPFLLALWPIVRPLLPYMIAVAAIGAGWLWLDQRCNAACQRATAKLKQAERLIEDAQQRATDLALLWSRSIDKAAEEATEAKRKRDATFASIADRSRHIGSSGSIRISADAFRLWVESSNAANDPAAAGEHQAPSDPIPIPAAGVDVAETELRDKWREAAAAYADARDLHMKCVAAYETIRRGDSLSGERDAANVTPP